MVGFQRRMSSSPAVRREGDVKYGTRGGQRRRKRTAGDEDGPFVLLGGEEAVLGGERGHQHGREGGGRRGGRDGSQEEGTGKNERWGKGREGGKKENQGRTT
jgi:hypothetical protein